MIGVRGNAMDITVPPDIERFISDQVARGHYVSPVDVVIAGLALLREQETIDLHSVEQLREAVQVGMAQASRGQVSPAVPMALLEEVEREFTDRDAG